ncbi:M3B_PepF domain containing protein [Paracoccaceae bacterium]
MIIWLHGRPVAPDTCRYLKGLPANDQSARLIAGCPPSTPFGLDASDPKFWDKGLSMIAGFIDELEAMEA